MTRVEVTGDKAVIAKLERAAHDVAQLEGPTRAAAREVERSAARRAPKRTGRLAASNSVSVAGGLGTVRNTVRYAPYVEYGTRYMRAQPFLRPALYLAPIDRIYEQHAERAVRDL